MYILTHTDYFQWFHTTKFKGIITDPPYKNAIKNKLNEQEFSFPMFAEKTYTDTEKNAFLITFSNFLCAIDLIPIMNACGWRFCTYQIWDKRPVRNFIAWSYPLRHTEFILYFTKGDFIYSFKNGRITPPYKRQSFGGMMKPDKIPAPNNRDRAEGVFEEILTFRPTRHKIHPTEKPVEFSHYFTKLVGGPNVSVLDPFAGSCNLVRAFNNSVAVDIEYWGAERYLPYVQRLDFSKKENKK